MDFRSHAAAWHCAHSPASSMTRLRALKPSLDEVLSRDSRISADVAIAAIHRMIDNNFMVRTRSQAALARHGGCFRFAPAK